MLINYMIKKEKIYDVVGLGACGIDLRAKAAKLPSANHKVIAKELNILEGGVTANNLVQATKLGLSTKWIGALGEDSWAKHLLKKFKETKVSAKPIIIKNFPTQQYWIITDPKGEWNMVGIPGVTRKLSDIDVKNKFFKDISQAKHFHTEVAVIPLAAALEGAKIAKKSGAQVLVDIDDDPWYLIEKEKIGTKQQLIELLKITDVVKLSQTGALGLTRKKTFSKDIIKKIISMGPKIIVVTLADKGCYIGTKSKIISANGFKVKTIDTVGAGDAFMGGLSYGILKSWSLEKIGTFANACGAFKCTQFGTRSSGNLKQITKFIKKRSA